MDKSKKRIEQDLARNAIYDKKNGYRSEGDYDIRMGPRVEKIPTGYSDCGCNVGWESGTALDPFAGSGTVGLVCKEEDRDFIGIELNPEYCAMGEDRIGSVVCQEDLFA